MFGSLITIVLIAATIVGGLFGFNKQQDNINYLEQQLEEQEVQNLGSYYSVGGKYYKLWGSGITSSATSLILQSFTIPISDVELVMANFGDIGYGTIEPNNVSNVEFISFTGITQASDSAKATLTGVHRGLSFVYPYAASTTLAKAHPGGSRFIISNPPMHYSEYATRKNAELIWGDWTYSATNTPQYNESPSFTSGSLELTSVEWVSAQTNAGAADASTSTAGIVEIATNEELLDFTTTTGDTDRRLVIDMHRHATSTDKLGATTTVVMTDSDGKIDQSFYDLSEEYRFTGDLVSIASSTQMGTTTIKGTILIGTSTDDSLAINASTTAYGTTTIGVSSSDILRVGASTTFTNTTTTFDRPPVVLDNANATVTDPYSLATKSYVDSKLIHFVSSVATTTQKITAAYIDLDLSSIVGTNEAMVYFKLSKGGTGGSQALRAITKGDTTSAANAGGATVSLAANDAAYLLIKTDTSGVIQITDASTDGGVTTWTVIAYIK